MPTDQRFPAGARIKSAARFQEVFQQGRFVADACLVVTSLRRADGEPARLGITIPKRVGNAPRRNRWKRLIREVFRRHRGELPVGWDLVVRPKKGAELPTYAVLTRAFPKLLRRACRNQPEAPA